MCNNPITVVEFCAGYGGLGLGIKAVLGSKMRVIGYCELEGFAQANLISKMEAGLLDAAPIWPNLRTFPYRKFRGLVDIACAGIPCQPHSHAGKRQGGADERFLFDDWLTGCEQMQPRVIFIENVEGLLSSKMPDGSLCIAWTVERLEAMGYGVEAGLFSASVDAGAPHQRKRVFILAHRLGAGLEGWLPRGPHTEREALDGHLGCGSPSLSGGGHPWPARPGEPQHDWEPPRVLLGDTERGGRQSWNGGRQETEVARAGRESGRGRLSGESEIESALDRDLDGTPSRMAYAELCTSCDSRWDELRLAGNGVVPQCAESAFRSLLNRVITT